jgi:hypothetical protein
MPNAPQPYTVVSLRDIELEGQISCAQRRIVFIAPGLFESVARAIIKKWHELGRDAIHVVLDLDPEVCRLGLGELTALRMLHDAADRLGSQIYQQPGLRVGLIVTDETTTIYSPTPRLIRRAASLERGLTLSALNTRFSNSTPPPILIFEPLTFGPRP